MLKNVHDSSGYPVTNQSHKQFILGNIQKTTKIFLKDYSIYETVQMLTLNPTFSDSSNNLFDPPPPPNNTKEN